MVYRPTARVLTVLELLQSHGRMTGPELARRLEVNIRTVRDYVEMLVDLGIPVEAERGRYGAYRLRPGYKLPPLLFTEDEALVLTLGLLMTRENESAQTAASFEGALSKIERVLPAATRQGIQAMEQTVVFERRALSVSASIATVMKLSIAVQSERCVRLRYRSARSEETERTFNPFGIVSHEDLWYTIGYCHLRQGERLLRLDRIEHIEITDEAFLRPAHFEALTSVHRALASVPRLWQVEVWLGTTLEEAWHKSQFSKGHFVEVNNGVILRGEVEDLPWMARLLAGLGVPFRIHHPPELRAAVSHYALALIQCAEQV